MRRLLLPLVLAVVVAACGGGGTGPTPVGLKYPRFYSGTVTFSRHFDGQQYSITETMEGSVVWEEDEPRALLGGTTTYSIRSGALKVTYAGSAGPCTQHGETTLVLGGPSDGQLVLNPDGTYKGVIESEFTTYTVTQSCFGQTKTLNTDAFIFLNMKGPVAANGNIQGRLEPFTTNTVTFAGSWNFYPVD